jgi:hypothetical protein
MDLFVEIPSNSDLVLGLLVFEFRIELYPVSEVQNGHWNSTERILREIDPHNGDREWGAHSLIMF